MNASHTTQGQRMTMLRTGVIQVLRGRCLAHWAVVAAMWLAIGAARADERTASVATENATAVATETETNTNIQATDEVVATPRPAGTALPPPRSAQGESRGGSSKSGRSLLPPWDTKRVGIVLAMFAGLMAVQRILTPRAVSNLPASAVQVCGKVPLDSKQFVHLVKIGERLLVLLESPQGVQRLAEITDPAEVQALLSPAVARAANSPSPSHTQKPVARFNAMNPSTMERSRRVDDDVSPEVRQMLAQYPRVGRQ